MTISMQKKVARRHGRARAIGCRLRALPLALTVLLFLVASMTASAKPDSALVNERADDTNTRPVVGFVTGHGEPGVTGQYSGVATLLALSFDVVEVSLSGNPRALDNVDVLVVAGHPDIPDAELYELDQFIMRGGRTAFLLDAAVIPSRGTHSLISDANVFGFLSVFGIVVNPDLVLDVSSAGRFEWGELSAGFSYPHWPVAREDGIAQSHPIVSDFGSIRFPWTSSISLERAKLGDAHTDVLVRSSRGSWTVSAYTDIDPTLEFAPPTVQDDVSRVASDRGFPLAVAIEGGFRSAFTGKKVIVQDEDGTKFVEPEGMVVSGSPTRMVVFGNSMMFRDDLSELLPGNDRLMACAVEWLLSEIGSRPEITRETEPAAGPSPRRLGFIALAVALLAMSAGVLRAALRRRGRDAPA